MTPERLWSLVTSGIAAWLLIDALRTGRSQYRGFRIDRASTPVRFWLWLALWSAILLMSLWLVTGLRVR